MSTEKRKVIARRYRSKNGESRPYLDGGRYKWRKKVLFPDGSSEFVTGSGITRTLCEESTHKLISKKLASHKPEQNAIVTTSKYCDFWLKDVVTMRGLREKTLQGYNSVNRLYIQRHLNTVPITNITREQIQSFYAELIRQGKGHSVIKEVRAVLRGALDEAVSSGLLSANPANGIKLPTKEKKVPVYFTLDESQRILRQALKQGEYLQWSIALGLGLRQGERLGLKWSDVDLDSDDPRLNIERSLARITGRGLIATPTKTNSSKRVLPLTPELVQAFRSHKKIQSEAKLAFGWRWGDEDFIFTTREGKPIDAANDRKAWSRLLRASGVEYKKLHAARHTTATLMHSNGVDLLSISHVLGHSSIVTTAEFYAHVPLESKQKAVNALAVALSTAPLG